MKVGSVFLYVAVAILLLISVVTADLDEKCANWKKCSKDLRKISALRPDGSCVTYNNHCLLNYAIICEQEAFATCFRGPNCTPDDESRVIGCQHQHTKHVE